MSGFDFAAAVAAYEEELRHERQRAAAAGEQYADEIDVGIRMDPGAPMPHVLADGRKAIVLTYLRSGSEAFDGTNVRIADPRGDVDEPIGLIEFSGVYSLSFGDLNDEALDGHPLSGQGLRRYAFHEVHNSAWIGECEHRNEVHPAHRGGWHQRYRHYILTFHDETFECIAESIKAEVMWQNMQEALAAAVTRLNLD